MVGSRVTGRQGPFGKLHSFDRNLSELKYLQTVETWILICKKCGFLAIISSFLWSSHSPRIDDDIPETSSTGEISSESKRHSSRQIVEQTSQVGNLHSYTIDTKQIKVLSTTSNLKNRRNKIIFFFRILLLQNLCKKYRKSMQIAKYCICRCLQSLQFLWRTFLSTSLGGR